MANIAERLSNEIVVYHDVYTCIIWQSKIISCMSSETKGK